MHKRVKLANLYSTNLLYFCKEKTFKTSWFYSASKVRSTLSGKNDFKRKSHFEKTSTFMKTIPQYQTVINYRTIYFLSKC